MAWWNDAQQREAVQTINAAGMVVSGFVQVGTTFRPVTEVWFEINDTYDDRKAAALVAKLDDKFTEENDAAKR